MGECRCIKKEAIREFFVHSLLDLYPRMPMSYSGGFQTQSPFPIQFEPRRVRDVIAVPPLLRSVLEHYRAMDPRPSPYCSSPTGEIEYARDILRPYAHAIQCCIPPSCRSIHDLPEGRFEDLLPHVKAYIEKAVGYFFRCRAVRELIHLRASQALVFSIAHTRAARTNVPSYLDTCVTWSLRLAWTFDALLGQPLFNHPANVRDQFLSCVSLALNIADEKRTPSSAFDLILSPEIVSLPRVPDWTRARIAAISLEEQTDNWACENALLSDEIIASQNVGQAMDKAADHASLGYAPNPSGRYFV
jgi:hypothetical protein